MLEPKKNLWIGLALGLVLPFVGYGILLYLNEQILASGNFGAGGDEPIFDIRTLSLMAICFNLIPFTYYQRNRLAKGMRGVLGATLVFAFIWVFYYKDTF